MLLLQLFGGVALLDDSTPVVGPAVQRRRLALLALLAASPTRGLSRDKLIAFFWPDEEREKARHFLADSLHTLRKQLGKEAVLTVGDDLVLNGELVRADVADFHEVLARGDREGAVALYRGPFLDGFFVSDAPEFERWVETERGRLARLCAEALETLAKESAARGEHDRAAHWWGKLAALDPLNSRVALGLMQSLGAAGERARAIQHARVHAALLREELDAAPDPEVEAYATELARAPEPSPPAPAPIPVPVVAPLPEPDSAPPEAPLPPLAATRVSPAAAMSDAPEARRGRRGLALAAGMVLLFVLALVPALGWLRGGLDDAPVGARETTTIAVFPFGVSGEQGWLSEAMVDLISIGVDGAGDVRAADPFVLLAQVAALGKGEPLTPEEAAELSLSLDADVFLFGKVIESDGRLRINASLYDARDAGAEPENFSVAGNDPYALADELVRLLLARLLGDPNDRLSNLAVRSTDSIEALKAYLEGERHFRAARYDLAAESFRRAVQEDPDYVLAHYRLSTSAEWSFDFIEARQAAGKALELAERLTERDRRLIAAWNAFVNGDPELAEQLYDAILVDHPNDVEALSGQGEVRAHYNPVRGRPVSEARPFFERVLDLAPNYGEARFHMLELAAGEGNEAAFDSLFAGVGEESGQRLSWEAAHAVSWGTAAEARAMLERLKGADQMEAGIAAVRAAAHFRDPAAAEAIARLLTTPDHPRGWWAAGHIFIAQGALVRGDLETAQAHLDSARVKEEAWALEIAALSALLPDASPGANELRRLRAELERWDPAASRPEMAFFFAAHADAHAQIRFYLLALLSARLGEDDDVERYVRELRRAGATSEGKRFGGSLQSSIAAHQAARRGQHVEALRLLQEGEIQVPLERIALSPFFARALDRWLRAELLRDLNRPEDALVWYRSLTDGPDVLFWAPAHEKQAEIHARLGRREEAARHLDLVQTLRPAPVPRAAR